jgi:hypothetical protein
MTLQRRMLRLSTGPRPGRPCPGARRVPRRSVAASFLQLIIIIQNKPLIAHESAADLAWTNLGAI